MLKKRGRKPKRNWTIDHRHDCVVGDDCNMRKKYKMMTKLAQFMRDNKKKENHDYDKKEEIDVFDNDKDAKL